ncbi:hypothetical protein [Clostridium sp.]|uniref:hypothetical protein n=1 Tax=Clostridium sp. TaxID=1506 RepID=UPI00260E49B0|nr:hypothetical protein [Clostridium sp.]
MNAYVFKKKNNIIFNEVVNCIENNENRLSSKSETFHLNVEEDDYILTNLICKIGDKTNN